MMLEHEVIEAADNIEAAIGILGEMQAIVGDNMKIYVPDKGLAVHVEDAKNLHILFNYTYKMNYADSECSVNLGMRTWLKYRNDNMSDKRDNTMMQPTPNGIILSTNNDSDKVIRWTRLGQNGIFNMHEIGTPECDEYLFLRSLEEDDYTMNVLMFQYEWRRRHGMNIVLRLGSDPVHTCSLILQTVKDVYEKYIGYIGNPENDPSVRAIQ